MRAWIEIELENEIKEELANVQVKMKAFCRRATDTPKEQFRLILHFLGEIEMADLDYLKEAMYETARRNRPFAMKIEKIGFFAGERNGILWAGIEKNTYLQRLFTTLEKSLEQQGFARDRKGFRPYITLCKEVELYRGFQELQKKVQLGELRVMVKKISLVEVRGKQNKTLSLFQQELIGKG